MKLSPLDIVFSEFIRRRAIQRVGGCERCLTPKYDIVKENGDIFPAWKQLQCSHFHGRARRSVRWDEMNAAGLCPGCHMYFTAHPLEHVEWFKTYIGEAEFDLLSGRMRQTHPKPDEKLLLIYYQNQIKELDSGS